MSYELRKKTAGDKRNISLDIIRFIAIGCVILNHSVEMYYGLWEYDVAVAIHSLSVRSVLLLLFTIGRLGVPLFLMLTGFLLLHRDYDAKGSLKHFWIHNLLSLIITWQIWLFIYNCLISFLEHTPFDTASWIRQMLFVKDNDYAHSWYIPVIIGIYFFIPFIAKGLKNISIPVVIFILCVSYAAFFVVPSVNLFFGLSDTELLSLKASPAFISSAYCAYILSGHLMYMIDRRNESDKKNSMLLKVIAIVADICIVIAGIALTLHLQLYLHAHASQYNVWYTFFVLPVVAFCLFDLLRRIKGIVFSGFIRRVSICSFGMYLIHFPLQTVLIEKNTPFNIFTSGWDDKYIMILLFFITFFVSYGITEGLAHIPVIGELLVKVRNKYFNIF